MFWDFVLIGGKSTTVCRVTGALGNDNIKKKVSWKKCWICWWSSWHFLMFWKRRKRNEKNQLMLWFFFWNFCFSFQRYFFMWKNNFHFIPTFRNFSALLFLFFFSLFFSSLVFAVCSISYLKWFHIRAELKHRFCCPRKKPKMRSEFECEEQRKIWINLFLFVTQIFYNFFFQIPLFRWETKTEFLSVKNSQTLSEMT